MGEGALTNRRLRNSMNTAAVTRPWVIMKRSCPWALMAEMMFSLNPPRWWSRWVSAPVAPRSRRCGNPTAPRPRHRRISAPPLVSPDGVSAGIPLPSTAAPLRDPVDMPAIRCTLNPICPKSTYRASRTRNCFAIISLTIAAVHNPKGNSTASGSSPPVHPHSPANFGRLPPRFRASSFPHPLRYALANVRKFTPSAPATAHGFSPVCTLAIARLRNSAVSDA